AVQTRPGSIPSYVHDVEQVVIDTLAVFGLPAGRLPGYPGVWVEAEGPNPRKICAIGVKVNRGRSMHGLALNVAPDLAWFDRIVPCGIPDKAVTSMQAEGIDVALRDVADALVGAAAARWGGGTVERQDVAWPIAGAHPVPAGAGQRLRLRLKQADVDPESGLALEERKPSWLRVPAHMGPDFHSLRSTVRGLDLVTVCEEAGCPNIFECWADGTATFMINGERCTRACGFCLVDTRRPRPLDLQEPERVAAAVRRLGLGHAVVTAVARDDLGDGGAGAFAATVEAIRRACTDTAVELLVPDCKGDPDALERIFASRPDVLNHNLETVARLQRAVRPSAGYARSLSVLGRAKAAGLTTKSGLILGMGEHFEEVVGALADLRAVGVDIVTLGQYLRPTRAHLPVARWWHPEEFDQLAVIGRDMGFAHVQASPLTRSSYHARAAAEAASGPVDPAPVRFVAASAARAGTGT
ncbi:MAG TPA: lipoyl synthase, partial [Acidimicrobiales bacterium]|nr:lipoyl synthase [Acidimicrobiales bacterium]